MSFSDPSDPSSASSSSNNRTSRPFSPLNYKNPTIVPYKSSHDLVVLKDWFYNFSPQKDQRFRAVQRVRALASRGKVPHGVEATSFLTLVCLQDNGSLDSDSTQLAYTMALIRFVNGLIDPFQQSQYAVPMHHIAKTLGLPTFFVELRHMGTHESLPSLELCRIACHKALNWLYDNYWCYIDEEESYYVDYQVEIEQVNSKSSRILDQYNKKLDGTQLTSNLKSYKKMRKVNLDSDHKPVGTKQNVPFWKIVKNIKRITTLGPFINHPNYTSFGGMDLLVTELLFNNYLVYNADKIQEKENLKFNPLLIKLYKPFLEEMGAIIKLKIVVAMLQSLEQYLDDSETPELFKLTHPFESVQFLEWINYLCGDLAENPPKFPIFVNNKLFFRVENKSFPGCNTFKSNQDLFEFILNYIITVFNKNKNQNLEIYHKIFTTMGNETSPSKVEPFLRKIKYLIDFQKFQAPSLDEILGSKRENEEKQEGGKRQKIEKTYLFEEHENWKPVPFGVPM